MKVEDFLTHIDNPEDTPFLRTKLLDVNMRLFASSQEYKRIVLLCASYVEKMALTRMEGYKKPHGMSGANLAIPFNIIAYVKNRGLDNEQAVLMLNPKVIGSSREQTVVQSNCGSIRLKQPIPVARHCFITVQYHDLVGRMHIQSFDRDNGGLTVQHEIDHNLGILITDRQI